MKTTIARTGTAAASKSWTLSMWQDGSTRLTARACRVIPPLYDPT